MMTAGIWFALAVFIANAIYAQNTTSASLRLAGRWMLLLGLIANLVMSALAVGGAL